MADNGWMVAQDTFTAELASGAWMTVTKGTHLPAGHEVVKLDAGRGMLFQPADSGEPEPPAKSGPAKAEPAKAAPVKAAGKAS